jgi:hypothetical protein
MKHELYFIILISAEEINNIFNEERRLLKAARKLEISIASYEDEGFISGKCMDRTL